MKRGSAISTLTVFAGSTVLAALTALAVLMIAAPDASAEWQYRGRLDIASMVRKDLSLRVLTEVRSINDLHTQNESYFDIGVDYRFRKWLEFGPHYRHVTYEKGETWEVEQRPYVDMTFKLGPAGLAFSNRNRFEYRMKDGDDTFRYRTRLMLKMKAISARRIQPYFSDEVYYALSSGKIDKNRFIAGFEIGLPGSFSLGVEYVLDSMKKNDTWTDLNAILTALRYRP